MRLVNLRRNFCCLKWTLKKIMTPLIGAIWIRLWRVCLFRFSGGNGLENVWVLQHLQFLLMVALLMSFIYTEAFDRGIPSPLFLLAAEGLNILMKAMVDNNLFIGYMVGTVNNVVVSHLQFADDTLLLGSKSWANVQALRATLIIFESISGLKVYFHKLLLVEINISDSWMTEAAAVLSCKVGKIPFMYLGLPIGGNPRRLSFWDPIVNRIKTRLLGWNSRFLSFSGRLILLKAVLTSLPIYALSFFKAPPGIISSIESLLNKFFWGGSEDSRKITWIGWNTLCSKKEHGGLGVRKLKEFNIALLGKWCWRILVDREGLWYHVLAARMAK